MAAAAVGLDRAKLEAAFERLGQLAAQRSKLVEIAVYGGSAVVLTFPSRVATRDVDAVFITESMFVRSAAAEIATEFGLSENWLNDGVKGFLSERDRDTNAKSLFGKYPASDELAGLRVYVASPAYLFAMKAMAMRIGGTEGSRDVDDIRLLGHSLGVETYQAALSLVSAFYPQNRISPKTQFGLMELFGGGDTEGT